MTLVIWDSSGIGIFAAVGTAEHRPRATSLPLKSCTLMSEISKGLESIAGQMSSWTQTLQSNTSWGGLCYLLTEVVGDSQWCMENMSDQRVQKKTAWQCPDDVNLLHMKGRSGVNNWYSWCKYKASCLVYFHICFAPSFMQDKPESSCSIKRERGGGGRNLYCIIV